MSEGIHALLPTRDDNKNLLVKRHACHNTQQRIEQINKKKNLRIAISKPDTNICSLYQLFQFHSTDLQSL